jgi:ubiquinone/menaquinone biosynthesis C-methylase UbiE
VSANLILAIVWAASFVALMVLVMTAKRTRRRGGTMTAGVAGAIWDLQSDEKRKALEIIVEKKAAARRPEYADGNLPELELPDGTDDFSRLEYRGWQRVASKYDATWSGLTRLFIPDLLDAAGIRASTQVLDVACGPGYVTEAALNRGAVPIGVDFAPEMIRVARARCAEIDVRRGDAQSLEFPDEQFDAVVMNFGLLHLANPEMAFSEAARVLRAGGRYAFTAWAGPDQSPGARIAHDAVAAHGNMDVSVPKGPDDLRHGRREDWQRILADVGLDPQSVAIRTVRVEWIVPTPSFLFEAECHAGVRTAALLAAQTPEALAAISRQMDESVRTFAKGDGFAIPYVAFVVSATAI